MEYILLRGSLHGVTLVVDDRQLHDALESAT
jgi:hypothetical protein